MAGVTCTLSYITLSFMKKIVVYSDDVFTENNYQAEMRSVDAKLEVHVKSNGTSDLFFRTAVAEMENKRCSTSNFSYCVEQLR